MIYQETAYGLTGLTDSLFVRLKVDRLNPTVQTTQNKTAYDLPILQNWAKDRTLMSYLESRPLLNYLTQTAYDLPRRSCAKKRPLMSA
eukprot:3277663-Amphidinium_carterae.1